MYPCFEEHEKLKSRHTNSFIGKFSSKIHRIMQISHKSLWPDGIEANIYF